MSKTPEPPKKSEEPKESKEPKPVDYQKEREKMTRVHYPLGRTKKPTMMLNEGQK